MLTKHLLKLSRVRSSGKISSSADIRRSYVSGHVNIDSHARLVDARLKGNISIGKCTSIFGKGTFLFSSINVIEIGAFCSIARNVTIQEYFHNYKRATTYSIYKNLFKEKNDEQISKGPIKIGSDVWIGTGSVILSGVSIGEGAIIGANAVVTRDVPAYTVVAGVPAKKISMRFDDDVIQYLQASKWWEKDLDSIKNNKEFFELDLHCAAGKLKLKEFDWK